ncbi:hypothetical protein [Hymenobacter algoricola]|uniref:Uncharacterized protein n=1 Tax=Hymenobacter algoricola TaxID=486267 RepID=A0ABP7NIP5_9BACT
MSSDLQLVETVEKEVLSTLHYPATDVLTNPVTRQQRHHDAARAALLGNSYHGKVDIYFRTADGATKRVYTTVWAADEEYLALKAGGALPVRAVLRFEFY